MCVVYRADLYTIFRPKEDIVGQVLSPCVCVCACMRACVCVCVQTVYPDPSVLKLNYKGTPKTDPV